ncbi:Phage-related baseplate assembly protein [Marinomonas spartinae]|uniref:Phage-related baseplate assembly protein n=1 Tax=Marinomonas spartinae TaxID=1792290 RepID=A0A1A8TLH7_9GAMM|nr:type VI secretion system tip protein TssI/VgrG [Marinomonas spartinae]SBS34747.1 Phage-related baseplate assembly protein [Marinomonas spartinae]SBS38248.1 Phage-related baseplate assembly protein [Marinomonas spartinae]
MQNETQKNNVIQINTPLGKDALYLSRIVAQEAMSDLFVISASVYALGRQIAHEDLLGKPVSILVKNSKNDGERYFHGIVSDLISKGSRVADTNEQKNFIDYQVIIVPYASSMRNRKNSRIYQKKTIKDIFSDLFGQHNVAFKDQTTKTYPKYEYCVQYQETDFDFIQRLLQEEGIFYFFEHTKSNHTLVLSDDATAYKECDESKVAYSTGHLSDPHVSSWQGGLSLAPGSFKRVGYDFKQPARYPDGEQKKSTLPTQSSTEVFEYTGEDENNARAANLASIQLESLQRDMKLSSGKSDCRSFSVGKLFSFKKHEDPRLEGKSFVITSMLTTVSVPNQSGGSTSSISEVYSNHFECVPKEVPYRPQAVKRKPTIQGIQTAIVTGDSADEIMVDKYGRVKVQFDWDREGKKDSQSSCWIRVAQNWAGKKWGAFFFPRVGQEVLVDFINGDPDQPIISGAVYNADLMPPYDLPAQKTQSGIKTRSTKEGGADNFNELRFEDKKGNELVYLQAEKDQQLYVKNDRNDKVDHDVKTEIGNNETLKVKMNRSSDIGENDTLKVGKVLNIEAGKEIVIKTGSAQIKMSSSGDITIEGSNINIKGSNVKVNGSAISLSAGSIKLN